MPDCHQSTDQHPPNPSPRRQRSSRATSRDRELHTHPTANTRSASAPTGGASAPTAAQREIRGIVEALRRIDDQLAVSAHQLPVSSDRFDALAEVRAAIDCVRTDLLADAIETLTAAATATERQLKACFEERRQWAAASV